MTDSEGIEEIGVFVRRKEFCEDVSGVIECGDIIEFDGADIDLLTCVMMVNVYVILLVLFFINAMNGWLSVKTGIGVKSCLKSFLSLINQIPSANAMDPATNSISIEE